MSASIATCPSSSMRCVIVARSSAFSRDILRDRRERNVDGFGCRAGYFIDRAIAVDECRGWFCCETLSPFRNLPFFSRQPFRLKILHQIFVVISHVCVCARLSHQEDLWTLPSEFTKRRIAGPNYRPELVKQGRRCGDRATSLSWKSHARMARAVRFRAGYAVLTTKAFCAILTVWLKNHPSVPRSNQ